MKFNLIGDFMSGKTTDLTQKIGDGLIGLIAGSGIITFMNENAGALSVIISFLGLILAAFFYWLNYRARKAEERDRVARDAAGHVISILRERGLDVDRYIEEDDVTVERRRGKNGPA